MISSLMQYGLTEKEARAYLLCLEYSALQPSTIASKLGINRVTCYDMLQWLCRKWLVAESIRNKVKRYVATSPDVLLDALGHKYEQFKAVIPDLISLSGKFGIKPKIKRFEWLEGMKSLYEDTLSSTEPILAYVWNQVAHGDLLAYFKSEYVPRRVHKKIFANVLLCQSDANQIYSKWDKKNYRKSLFLKEGSWEIQCEINIYGPHKIMIAMYDKSDMCGLIVESGALYETMKTIFNHIRTSLDSVQ
jgi:sugar-specific transcriptional regulator TrmB